MSMVVSLWISWPDVGFIEPQRLQVGGAQRRVGREQELVELRRRDRRAGEHRMGLAAMMDLVHEEMRQDAVGAVLDHAGIANEAHGAVRCAASSRSQNAMSRRSTADWPARSAATVARGASSLKARGRPSSAST